MSNLEIMDKAVTFTTGAYIKAYYDHVKKGRIPLSDLDKAAIDYSGSALMRVLNSPDGMCNDYTRKGNLRYDIASIGEIGIKNELLKNVVNVAVYNRTNHLNAEKKITEEFKQGMTDDEIAVIIFNNIVSNGVGKGYDLLNDPKILFSACRTFADYRRVGKKEILDDISSTNNIAMYINNELDTYCDKYNKVVTNNEYIGK